MLISSHNYTIHSQHRQMISRAEYLKKIFNLRLIRIKKLYNIIHTFLSLLDKLFCLLCTYATVFLIALIIFIILTSLYISISLSQLIIFKITNKFSLEILNKIIHFLC